MTETILDRAINYVAPVWGARRMMARQAQASYRGGIATRMSELYGRPGQRRLGTSADRIALQNARDRGYQAYRDNPVARTVVNTETDNVIGDGLNYQPTSSSEEWNKEAKDRYYQWTENCEVRRIYSGAEVQRMLWSRSRVAGDIGWILVRRGAESFIQIVAAENICSPDGRAFDPNLVNGILFDRVGAPISFWVLDVDELGNRDFTEISYRDFVYLPHFPEPNQVRGESLYVPIFNLLAHLDRYIDGVSLAAWMATVFGIVFKQKNAGKIVSGLDFTTNAAGEDQRAVTFENGSVKYVGTDDEVAQVQAHQPMQNTPDFIRAIIRLIGATIDMPLEVIAKDMSTCTFASARIGLLPFYRACRIKAGHFASRWSRTIRWWLDREKNRAPDDPKKWRSVWPVDYYNHDLLPNEWTYTDPVSEAQGDWLEVLMGSKSMQMVIEERGRDSELIIQQRKAWQEMTKGLKTVYSTMTRDEAPAPTDQSGSTNNG